MADSSNPVAQALQGFETQADLSPGRCTENKCQQCECRDEIADKRATSLGDACRVGRKDKPHGCRIVVHAHDDSALDGDQVGVPGANHAMIMNVAGSQGIMGKGQRAEFPTAIAISSSRQHQY